MQTEHSSPTSLKPGPGGLQKKGGGGGGGDQAQLEGFCMTPKFNATGWWAKFLGRWCEWFRSATGVTVGFHAGPGLPVISQGDQADMARPPSGHSWAKTSTHSSHISRLHTSGITDGKPALIPLPSFFPGLHPRHTWGPSTGLVITARVVGPKLSVVIRSGNNRGPCDVGSHFLP